MEKKLLQSGVKMARKFHLKTLTRCVTVCKKFKKLKNFSLEEHFQVSYFHLKYAKDGKQTK